MGEAGGGEAQWAALSSLSPLRISKRIPFRRMEDPIAPSPMLRDAEWRRAFFCAASVAPNRCFPNDWSFRVLVRLTAFGFPKQSTTCFEYSSLKPSQVVGMTSLLNT